MATPNNRIEIILTAIDKGLTATFGQVNKAMAAAEQNANAYGRSMAVLQAPVRALTGTLARLGGAFAAVFASQKYLQVAEEYSGLDARLRLVTTSAEEFAKVQGDLYNLSQQTGTGYQENAATYTKLAVALKDAGADSGELIRINEAVSKSLVVAGASAAETSSFLLQFGQAMGSGVLQGDELRSMLESNAYFSQQLATALDTNIAGLRKMGSEGKLTADVIRAAVPKMLQQIDQDFAKMPLTIGRAMTMLSNAFEKIVNGSNQAGGATGKIAEAIRSFVVYLENNGAQIEAFVVKLIDMGVELVKVAWEWKEFIAAFAGITVAASAVGTLVTSFKAIGAAIAVIGGANVALVAVVAAAGFAVGSIAKLVAQFFALRDATRELEQAQADAKLQADFIDPMIASKLGEVNAALGTTYSTMQELFDAEKRGEVHFDELTASWQRGSAAMAQSSSSAATVMRQVQGAALDEMKRKYQEYAAEVKRLQDQISGREKSLYEQLRDMARTGMSDVGAWQDLKAQAEEYRAVAEAAVAAGNFETAVKYADKAKDAYAQLNKEVSSGDKVVVSSSEALKVAMEGVEASGQIGIDALKALQDAASTAMEDLTEASGFQDLSKGMDEAEEKWLTNWKTMRETAIEDISKVEDRLAAIKDKEVTVWINEKVKKATGGPVGFRRGGKLSGYGGGDRISALLEAGEFVIRKEAVRKFGAGLFHQLNSLKLPQIPRFAVGGPVGPQPAMAMAAAGPTYNVTVNVSGGGNAQSIERAVLAGLAKAHARRSA